MGGSASRLWPFVRRLRHYDIVGSAAGVHVGMPSPAVTMVLALGPDLDLQMPAIGRRCMSTCLAGLHDHPAAIHHDGMQRGIQLDLSPLGLAALVGVPAAELAGTAVDLTGVFGRVAVECLMDRLSAEQQWRARLALVERFLADRLGRNADRWTPRPEVVRAWAMLARSGGSARIGDVAIDVGWSRRRLEQQFAATVGATPKVAARLMRFHRSVTMIAGGTPIADTAAGCGFADQAHLTREWRTLAGVSPARWAHQDVLANVQDAPTDRMPASSA
jgi:AraC-like DNA-binding protein